MKYIEPSMHTVHTDTGVLGNATGCYEKRLRDLTGLYADEAAFDAAVEKEGDKVVYSVTDVHPANPHGDLIYGVTRMEPGQIGGEFFLTRGHIHACANRPEIYYGEAGLGLMLLESPDGEVRLQEVAPRTLCYVPAYWIHRSINIGSEPLVMSFFYPADSGQDYSVIEKSGGMKERIMADAEGWQAVPNLNYRPRTPAEIKKIIESADHC